MFEGLGGLDVIKWLTETYQKNKAAALFVILLVVVACSVKVSQYLFVRSEEKDAAVVKDLRAQLKGKDSTIQVRDIEIFRLNAVNLQQAQNFNKYLIDKNAEGIRADRTHDSLVRKIETVDKSNERKVNVLEKELPKNEN